MKLFFINLFSLHQLLFVFLLVFVHYFIYRFSCVLFGGFHRHLHCEFSPNFLLSGFLFGFLFGGSSFISLFLGVFRIFLISGNLVISGNFILLFLLNNGQFLLFFSLFGCLFLFFSLNNFFCLLLGNFPSMYFLIFLSYKFQLNLFFQIFNFSFELFGVLLISYLFIELRYCQLVNFDQLLGLVFKSEFQFILLLDFSLSCLFGFSCCLDFAFLFCGFDLSLFLV